jgi:MFS family permease
MSSLLRRDLCKSTLEGMAASAMVGIGETYLPVFVLALSGSELACGLASTVPLVAGALVQLGLPWLLRKCGSYRRCVSLCAVVQAAAFLPLAAAAILGHMSIVWVFALIAVYWATGLGANGPWNAWIETLVPERVRARYFAWRTRVCQCGIGLGFVAGGMALELAGQLNIPLALFALLFLAAAASRLASAGLLASQREPRPPQPNAPGLSPQAIIHALTAGANGRMLLYLMAATVATQISSPYFNPYMLGELHFSYAIYTIVVCAAIVGKIVFLPTVGRVAQRVGARRVFWISSAAIIPVPVMWLVSNHYGYLIGVQVYAGMAWCTFDLATFLLFIETIPRRKRVEVLAGFALANAAATAAGSLLGASVLASFGGDQRAYFILFMLSTLARAAALLVLLPIRKGSMPRVMSGAVTAPHYLRRMLPGLPARAAKVPQDHDGVGVGSRT